MSKWQKHPSAVWSETIVDEHGDTVCSVACSYRTKAEINKTVALIMAAPEMLEALRELLRPRAWEHLTLLDQHRIKSAIAKATGGEG